MIARDLNHAAAAFNAGQYEKAGTLCDKVLARAPRNPDALHLRALAHLNLGDIASAIPLLERGLVAAPGHPEMLDALHGAAMMSGQFALAESAAARMLERAPDDPAVLMRLGNARAAGHRWSEAASVYSRAAQLAAERHEPHYSLGNVLLELGRPDEAKACFERALAIQPRSADAWNALGNALKDSGRSDEALIRYRHCLEIDPRHAIAEHNLGNALLELGRLDEAETHLRRAVELDPRYVKAWMHLGVAQHELGREEASIASFDHALAVDPGNVDVAYNYSQPLLFRRDFRRAWECYEQRLTCRGMRDTARKSAASMEQFLRLPRWVPGAGPSRVAVWCEQAVGEQLLFSTLLPELVTGGVDCIWEVDRRLLAAYERSFPGVRFVTLSDPPAPELLGAPAHVLCGSLARLYRAQESDFSRQPARLLQSDPARAASCRDRLMRTGKGLKVAIAWRSARADRLGPRKSARLLDLAPLLRMPDVTFVDVQYGDTDAERAAAAAETGAHVQRFTDVDHFNDLDELLAILDACDAVITTSNVTAHLAGVLGRPTWLLYPGTQPPFHYWTTAPTDAHSLWYPSVRILSGEAFADWAALAQRAASALADLRAP